MFIIVVTGCAAGTRTDTKVKRTDTQNSAVGGEEREKSGGHGRCCCCRIWDAIMSTAFRERSSFALEMMEPRAMKSEDVNVLQTEKSSTGCQLYQPSVCCRLGQFVKAKQLKTIFNEAACNGASLGHMVVYYNLEVV